LRGGGIENAFPQRLRQRRSQVPLPRRLAALRWALARSFLNSSFTETPSSVKRERRPTALLNPDDCASLAVVENNRVVLGNRRGEVVVPVKPATGQPRGVVDVEGILSNDSAVFHDTAVWVKPAG